MGHWRYDAQPLLQSQPLGLSMPAVYGGEERPGGMSDLTATLLPTAWQGGSGG